MSNMSWKKEKNERVNAGFWKRVLANAIDGIIITLPLMVIETALTMGLFGSKLMDLTLRLQSGEVTTDLIAKYTALQYEICLVDLIVGLILVGGYYILLEGARQATVGKMICNIKIVDQQGNPIAYKKAIARYFARYLSYIFMIGYIIPIFRKDRRTLHDIVTKTYVVKANE